MNVILDQDDRQRIAAFYTILINVEKRINGSRKSSKAKKTKTKDSKKINCKPGQSIKVRIKSRPFYWTVASPFIDKMNIDTVIYYN